METAAQLDFNEMKMNLIDKSYDCTILLFDKCDRNLKKM